MYRRENYAGITFYKFIEDIANNFENVKEEVAAKLKLLTEYVFRKENLVISYVCKDDEYDSLPGLVEDMTDSLYDKEPDSSILRYLLQPYNAGTELKSGAYTLVMSATYLICFSLMQLRVPVLLFGLMTIVFCVLYCALACVLIYKLAPKTFRIRT